MKQILINFFVAVTSGYIGYCVGWDRARAWFEDGLRMLILRVRQSKFERNIGDTDDDPPSKILKREIENIFDMDREFGEWKPAKDQNL